MEEHTFVLGLGSNCGDRESNLRSASDFLQTIFSCYRCSSFYETEPVGEKAREAVGRCKGLTSDSGEILRMHPLYMNAVCSGVFKGSRESIESLVKEYEVVAGRDSVCRSIGLVPVDIDIVVMDGQVVRPRDFNQRFFSKGFDEIKGDE